MRSVSRSALVPYSAAEMYALVDDVEAYPEFLPWCSDAVVHELDGEYQEATLELSKGGVSNRFTTRNRRVTAELIDIALGGGPFRQLQGGWRFQQLGDAGSKVSLALDFEFSSKIVSMMFGSFFEETCNSLVDAFTKRAQEVYGER